MTVHIMVVPLPDERDEIGCALCSEEEATALIQEYRPGGFNAFVGETCLAKLRRNENVREVPFRER